MSKTSQGKEGNKMASKTEREIPVGLLPEQYISPEDMQTYSHQIEMFTEAGYDWRKITIAIAVIKEIEALDSASDTTS